MRLEDTIRTHILPRTHNNTRGGTLIYIYILNTYLD